MAFLMIMFVFHLNTAEEGEFLALCSNSINYNIFRDFIGGNVVHNVY